MGYIILLNYLTDSCFKIRPQLVLSDWACDYTDQIQQGLNLFGVLWFW